MLRRQPEQPFLKRLRPDQNNTTATKAVGRELGVSLDIDCLGYGTPGTWEWLKKRSCCCGIHSDQVWVPKGATAIHFETPLRDQTCAWGLTSLLGLMGRIKWLAGTVCSERSRKRFSCGHSRNPCIKTATAQISPFISAGMSAGSNVEISAGSTLEISAMSTAWISAGPQQSSLPWPQQRSLFLQQNTLVGVLRYEGSALVASSPS